MLGLTRSTALAAAALAGIAIASAPVGSSPAWLLLGGALGLGVGLLAPETGTTGRLDLVAAIASLAFLAPIATMPVAPGADMAMHAALGRALWQGGAALSPAWGEVTAGLYPRGLSALIALSSPLLGFAKASLFAAGLSYLVAAFGLAAWLRATLRFEHPIALAAFTVLAAEAPQGFFDWGGNPTAMAFGLGLFSVAALAPAWRGEAGQGRRVAVAALLAGGALCTHPTGALVGLCSVVGLRWPKGRAGHLAVASLAAAVAVVLAALARFGPALSPSEAEWVSGYQATVERVLRGPKVYFALRVWREIPETLGWAWTAVVVASAAWLARSRERRRAILFSALGIVAVGAVVAFGPMIPVAGLLAYPKRFVPLFAVATAPLIGLAATGLARARPRLVPVLLVVAVAIAGWVHVRTFQRALPIATSNDIGAIACVERSVPLGEVVRGAYGDATQWIPALAGRRVTQAHPHISLDDEIRAQPTPPETFAFVGERLRYGERVEAPIGEPVCAVGGARLVRLR